MLRYSRSVALAVVPVVLALGLAGCGDSSSSSGADPTSTAIVTPEKNPDSGDTAARLDAVSVAGDLGKEPELTWSAQMTADKVESSTIIKGSGAELADGESVLANLVIADGFTKQIAFSTYDKDKGVQTFKVGDSQLGPLFKKALDGAHVGDRVAVTSSALEAFGQAGQPELGIGNGDAVLAVVDVMSAVAKAPKGTQTPAPAWMPKLLFTDGGSPSGFDFSAAPTPMGQFRKALLITGDGPPVVSGGTVVVNYLGEVFGGTKPFDQTYGKTSYTSKLDGFIDGWKQGLVGVPAGSRVVLQVPPKLGYGTKGNAGAGIKGTDTMFFVIDVLAAG